jgi:hypothetical protein
MSASEAGVMGTTFVDTSTADAPSVATPCEYSLISLILMAAPVLR